VHIKKGHPEGFVSLACVSEVHYGAKRIESVACGICEQRAAWSLRHQRQVSDPTKTFDQLADEHFRALTIGDASW
jgi:hypothetical protein